MAFAASGTHHLAGAYDSASGRLIVWVDGQAPLGCTALGSAGQNILLPASGTVYFAGSPAPGNTSPVPTGAYAGTLDDVRISNQVIYAGNTFTPARHPQAVTGTTLGLWPMDEGSGKTVHDTSGGGHDGTLSFTGWSWVPEP